MSHRTLDLTKECKDCKALIKHKATKCSECGSEQRLWRYLNQNFVQNIFSTIQILTIILGFWFAIRQLETAQEQIEETGRLTWMNGLDERSFQLALLAIEKPELGCIYKLELLALDRDCSSIVNDTAKLRTILEYTSMTLEHLQEVLIYSQEQKIEHYDKWYSQWAADLAVDPYGVIRYAILNTLQCNGDCVNLAKELLVCPRTTTKMDCALMLEAGEMIFQDRLRKLGKM